MIRRSKTDQEGQGQEIAIPRGTKLRPAEALRVWLDAAGISEGPIFRAVSRGDNARSTALGADVVGDIVKEHCERAGLDPALFAAHSLRAGLPDLRRRGGRQHDQAAGSQPSQVDRCADELHSAGRPLQGPRWRLVSLKLPSLALGRAGDQSAPGRPPG